MVQVRILWVHPQERQLQAGETYDEGAVSEAGYSLKDLLGRGEAELVSPLDHDGNGKAGGSLKGEQSTVAKGKAKRSK